VFLFLENLSFHEIHMQNFTVKLPRRSTALTFFVFATSFQQELVLGFRAGGSSSNDALVPADQQPINDIDQESVNMTLDSLGKAQTLQFKTHDTVKIESNPDTEHAPMVEVTRRGKAVQHAGILAEIFSAGVERIIPGAMPKKGESDDVDTWVMLAILLLAAAAVGSAVVCIIVQAGEGNDAEVVEVPDAKTKHRGGGADGDSDSSDDFGVDSPQDKLADRSNKSKIRFRDHSSIQEYEAQQTMTDGDTKALGNDGQKLKTSSLTSES